MTRCISAFALALAFAVPRPAASQTFSELRSKYDAGDYQQVVDAARDAKLPDDEQRRLTYLAARSEQKLSHDGEARRGYEQLAQRNESDPWHDIGRSALALLDSKTDEAVEAADRAVARRDSLPEAHFQRGMALSAKQDMGAAAAAFEKATELDPMWASAHYYAGLAYSKARRIDLTASHFNAFLKLAPQAPERPEVESIMKTLRGR
jgi:tetratricopeptide (TPR) repeat protein